MFNNPRLRRRAALALGLIAGCAGATSSPLFSTVQPLSNAAARGLAGKVLSGVQYPPVHLSAMTSSNMLTWGSIGGVIAGSKEGRNIERDNNLEDPQEELAARLRQRFARDRRMRTARDPALAEESTGADVAALATRHPDADYLLDVQLLGESLYYYPLDWNRYYLQFIASVRLIEVSSKSAIAEGSCQVKQESDPHPTKEQLLADNAALLKRLQTEALQNCENYLAAQILGLEP